MTRLMKKIKRRSMLKGLSLQARLPFLICALLLCVILVFSTMAYLEVRNSARKVAQIRLNSRIVQLATTFSQSTQGLLSANARIASNPDIISYLESGASFEKEAELLSYLASTRTDSSHIAVQVFDTNHKLKLSSKFSYIRDFDFPDTLLASLDSSNAGRLVSINDSVFYPLFSPVKDGKNNIIGYVVKWRLFKTTREALRQYTMLLGPEPQIFVGNKNASLWTDLITPINGPEKIDTTKTNVVEFRPDGYDVYATVKDVPGTPWLIMLGVPRSFVLQSVGTFLNWLFLAGGILLVVGFGAAWFLSRSITQPITKLTAATSAITSGGSAPPIDIDRTDEIGKLARAFNAMIIRVSNARNDLEKKVY
ncbi:MAG TPA: cache and HAMP domain-containing protein, partial [Parasegetibacter sp.]